MNGDEKLINDLSINSIQNDFDLLPKNEANLIPLKLIYERVIQNYYSELQNLSETYAHPSFSFFFKLLLLLLLLLLLFYN